VENRARRRIDGGTAGHECCRAGMQIPRPVKSVIPMIPKKMRIPLPAAVALAAFLTGATVGCESESDGPRAQPAEGIPDVPVTQGGQTPHVEDAHIPDVPNGMPADTAPAEDDATPYP